MSNRWSDDSINMVGAHAVNFPSDDVLHWQELRNAVESTRQVLRQANDQMATIEADKLLSADGLREHRAAVALQALDKLDGDKCLSKARQAAERRLQALEAKMNIALTDAAPKTQADAQVAGEIRQWISQQKLPASAAIERAKKDPRVLHAVLQSPGFLSNLNDDQMSAVRVACLENNPHGDEARQIRQALQVADRAVASAAQMVAQRASLRRQDGEWRPDPIRQQAIA
jgi:hypothetical protein